MGHSILFYGMRCTVPSRLSHGMYLSIQDDDQKEVQTLRVNQYSTDLHTFCHWSTKYDLFSCRVHLAMYIFSASKLAKDTNCLEEFEGGII